MFLKPEESVDSFGLREGDIVADFGAGMGAYAYLAAKRVGETGKVFAVDVQKELLASVKNGAALQGLKNIEIVWGDVEIVGGSKLKDGLADAVICANVLFQAEGKEGLAAEVKRVLKTGGRAIVIDWRETFGGMGPAKDHVVPRGEAKRIFEGAGLAFSEEIPAGKYHYGLIFRAP